MNRRDFFKHSVGVAAGFLLLTPFLAQAQNRRKRDEKATGATSGLALLDPKDPAAKNLNYAETHAEVKDAKLKIDRNGVKFDAQKCEGCQFYDKSKETTISGKKASACQLFPGKAVTASGWCTTWVKKA